MYSGEDNLLKNRFIYLDSFVDKFVIVESELTYKKNNKGFIFNPDLYKEFEAKIIYLKISGAELSKFNDPWEIEHFQRNYIFNGLMGCSDKDIVFVSDIDEFYFKDRINLSESEGMLIKLELDFSYFYVNYQSLSIRWTSSYFANFGYLKNKDLNKLRYDPKFYGEFKIMRESGVHLSYLGDFDRFTWKIDNLAEDWLVNFKSYKKEIYLEKIKYGVDIYNRDIVWYRISRENLNYPDNFISLFSGNYFIEGGGRNLNGLISRFIGYRILRYTLKFSSILLRVLFNVRLFILRLLR